MAPLESNEPHLSSALRVLEETIETVTDAGLTEEQVVLLGFSQGACLATEFATRNPQRYGGIVGLSGGLIGPEGTEFHDDGTLDGTPVFLGCSDQDPYVPLERVEETADVFRRLSAKVTKRIYEGMGHTVNRDELDAVFVGTWPYMHREMCCAALQAGKHVYCEKPMTRYLGEAFAVHDAVQRTGMTFQIGSQYCTEGKWHKAAEMIQNGKIGPLVLGQADYCRNNPDGEWNYTIDEDANPQHIEDAAE